VGGKVVSDGFGEAFAQLHPLLQSLHRHGGKLRGQVGTGFGHGLAGIADGRYRFSVRFALPLPGEVRRYGGLLDAVAPSSPAARAP
jgi:hypothetical protein